MRRLMLYSAAVLVSALALRMPLAAAPAQAGAQTIDLAERLAAKRLQLVNREATPITGTRPGVHLSAKEGLGIAWIEGTDLALGTIDVDVRGRDIPQQSFVGIAFHGQSDTAYEAVYLRPFNFRNEDVARRQNAVQYVALPDYDWPRLRKEFPSEFENPVEPPPVPTDWVPVRIVVSPKTVQIYVAGATTPTLEVRKLGTLERGKIGLWVGNNSDGDFANLRVTPAK